MRASSVGLNWDFILGAVSSISRNTSATNTSRLRIIDLRNQTFFGSEEGIRKRKGNERRDSENKVREKLALYSNKPL